MASIIAVGNPGVGKSTILNCLAEELMFKSGTSFGKGLTYQMDEKTNKNGRFFDTPGLADRQLREAAGTAITEALKKGGEYKILFFLRTQSGRAVVEDITTFKLVLNSAPEIGHQYGLVINQVNNKLSKKFKENHENKKSFLTDIFSNIDPKRHCSLNNISFLPTIKDAEDEDNQLIPLEDLKTTDGLPFKSFVNETIPSVALTEGAAQEISIHDFDKQTEEIEKLKKELNENHEMYEQKQKEMEQEMERKIQEMERKAEAARREAQQEIKKAEQKVEQLRQGQEEMKQKAQDERRAAQLAQQEAQDQVQQLQQKQLEIERNAQTKSNETQQQMQQLRKQLQQAQEGGMK